MTEPASGQTPAPMWCLIGNVVSERPFGPGGAETRTGTKHFSGGTKVYCLDTLGGGQGFEHLEVLGKHRGERGGLVCMVLLAEHITNWRAKVVYSPSVLRMLHTHGYDDSRDSDWRKGWAISMVAVMVDRELRRAGLPQRYGTQFADSHIIPCHGDPQALLYPLEDPKNVNYRRAELGLPPLGASSDW